MLIGIGPMMSTKISNRETSKPSKVRLENNAKGSGIFSYLIKEIAMDFCPIENIVTDLNFNKVPYSRRFLVGSCLC